MYKLYIYIYVKVIILNEVGSVHHHHIDRQLRHKEIKKYAHSHTASKWSCQDLHLTNSYF